LRRTRRLIVFEPESARGQLDRRVPIVAVGSIPVRGRRSTDGKLLMPLDCGVVSQTFASWNLVGGLLVRLDGLRRAA
jgi:hypothetical protein